MVGMVDMVMGMMDGRRRGRGEQRRAKGRVGVKVTATASGGGPEQLTWLMVWNEI